MAEKHKRNRRTEAYVFFTVLLLAGFFSGSLISYDLYKQNLVSSGNDATSLLSHLGSQEGFPLFIKCFFRHFIYIFIIWFLSLSIIGIIIVMFTVFFIGFMYGIVLSSFIFQLGFQGFLIGFFYTFPQNLILLPLLIYVSGNSAIMSLHIFQNFYQNGNRKYLKDLMSQYVNQLYFSILVIVFYALIVLIFNGFFIKIINALL